jgi:hypothetical protein
MEMENESKASPFKNLQVEWMNSSKFSRYCHSLTLD